MPAEWRTWSGGAWREIPAGRPARLRVSTAAAIAAVRTGPGASAGALLEVGLLAAAWCLLHSFFISLTWRRVLDRLPPRVRVWDRLVFVVCSTASLAALMILVHRHPARLLWDWPPLLVPVRWAGLAVAGLLFWLGARAHDGRAFLGLPQLRAAVGPAPSRHPPLRAGGILDRIRHPWYAGTLLLLVFMRPFSDVNLVWRCTFFVYTLVGTQWEERKLLKEFGPAYADYRRRVPRYVPRLGPRRR